VAPPLPAAGERWALFLDVDGTLAELAAHPDDVVVPPDLLEQLRLLQRLLGGALAVVSGRSIDSLDRVLAPLQPAAAGLHGLERRNHDGITRAGDVPGLDRARRELDDFGAANRGLMLEDKGGALALHYRHAPHLEDACRERSASAVRHAPRHHVLAGKMVFELKPRAANKGEAIRSFMGEAPFHGRVPVFAGDDRTDEDGFQWIQAHAGISIKVGDGETLARHRVTGVTMLHQWLARLAGRLEEMEHSNE